MDIYLRDSFGEQFHFPVNPEEITIQREKQLETLNILSLGEVELPQEEKVKTIAFSSFFPKSYDSSYCRYPELPHPQAAMNRLTSLMNRKQPIRLLITETAVNVLVNLSAHNTTFKGGEPDDVYFEVTFRTHREIKVRTSAGNAVGTTSTSNRPDTKPVPKVYNVKSGDTLWSIAKLELGDSSKWRVLYDKNKSVIGTNPNLIKPGQKLVMP
ncbi:LysM peptidoglycan-binding domain-containing protein [Cohnella silvisoli]|uniref:LysM peptidoglycan-binding domain-containing protein n=1 Tax=Cohnella silvisoli TaxID=2873699 RepID=A0ABV1KM60_9BACL|nr:LysM peptidoglycan-binding domain-containing protein [Cohnella silvisoli]MCD9020505.1 LysM peptidoglycan-binding domain-containing protein [Cohnella silvisoli]